VILASQPIVKHLAQVMKVRGNQTHWFLTIKKSTDNKTAIASKKKNDKKRKKIKKN